MLRASKRPEPPSPETATPAVEPLVRSPAPSGRPVDGGLPTVLQIIPEPPPGGPAQSRETRCTWTVRTNAVLMLAPLGVQTWPFWAVILVTLDEMTPHHAVSSTTWSIAMAPLDQRSRIQTSTSSPAGWISADS